MKGETRSQRSINVTSTVIFEGKSEIFRTLLHRASRTLSHTVGCPESIQAIITIQRDTGVPRTITGVKRPLRRLRVPLPFLGISRDLLKGRRPISSRFNENVLSFGTCLKAYSFTERNGPKQISDTTS